MVTLRPVDNSNIWEVAELDVRPDQQNLVMTATDSILECYGIEKSGGWAAPFGIYDGDTAVGFVMFTFGEKPCEWNPDCAKGTYEIDRFYIDRRYQGKGYGKAGIRAAVDYIRTLPCGPAPMCWIAYKPGNDIAARLYASAGFVETDMRNYEEIIAVLPLT